MKQPRLISDIPLFHKIYDLYKLMHLYHRCVPKSERYTVWQKCETTTLALLEILVDTSHTAGEESSQSLWRLSSKLELLKVFIQLAEDTNCLEPKQYLSL